MFDAELPAQTGVMLLNAIYFNGEWAKKFDPLRTERSVFNLQNGKTVRAFFMTRFDDFNFLDHPDMLLLDLDYGDNDTTMMLLLPKQKDSATDALGKIERSLSAKNVAEWRAKMEHMYIHVYLPRFKIDGGTVSLKPALEALGVRCAFSTEESDFCGMIGRKELFLADVVQRTFIDVNETGTVASSASGGTFAFSYVFRADRPFVFLILEKSSGQILFVGRVSNPAQ